MCILTRSPPEAVHLGISRFRKNTQTAPVYVKKQVVMEN